MFVILHIILITSCYIAQNKNLDEKSKIGYFAIVGIFVVIGSLVSFI